MRYAPHPWAATIVLDMAAYDDLVSIDEASAWIDLHPSYTGIEHSRQGRDLADENAWSPREVTMRLIWRGAGFPTPLTNRPVFDLAGRHIGTPDLIDPNTGVVGEYDGPLHLAGARMAVDLARARATGRSGCATAILRASAPGSRRLSAPGPSGNHVPKVCDYRSPA